MEAIISVSRTPQSRPTVTLSFIFLLLAQLTFMLSDRRRHADNGRVVNPTVCSALFAAKLRKVIPCTLSLAKHTYTTCSGRFFPCNYTHCLLFIVLSLIPPIKLGLNMLVGKLGVLVALACALMLAADESFLADPLRRMRRSFIQSIVGPRDSLGARATQSPRMCSVLLAVDGDVAATGVLNKAETIQRGDAVQFDDVIVWDAATIQSSDVVAELVAASQGGVVPTVGSSGSSEDQQYRRRALESVSRLQIAHRGIASPHGVTATHRRLFREGRYEFHAGSSTELLQCLSEASVGVPVGSTITVYCCSGVGFGALGFRKWGIEPHSDTVIQVGPIVRQVEAQ